MNLNKHLEFFNPFDINEPVHIIGVGALGSYVAVQLAKLGISKFYLYDFDHVEDHNVTNQYFMPSHVGELKVNVIEEAILDINPDAKVMCMVDGWKPGAMLSGYVFTLVDSIETRRKIAEDSKFNPMIKAMFDGRIRLTDAQVYCCPWNNKKLVDNFIATMAFSDKEADAATPVSACGTTLSVSPTVLVTVSFLVSQFINMVKGEEYHTAIIFDAFAPSVIAM